MHNALLIILGISILLILHTYLLYPAAMMLFFPRNTKNVDEFRPENDLPEIAILIAAYNEQNVIAEKINSVFNTSYPAEKIKIYVGSDASTDKTDEIVAGMQRNHPNLQLVSFPGRVGKIGIVNHLQSLVKEELLILTDANVIFEPNTIFELVKSFKDPMTGIVAANIIKVSASDEGISFQEKKYLSLENKIKAAESNAFQMIMGAEGGCYALRSSLFTKVPPTFIVDDFFITLSVVNAGKYVLFNSTAVCKEDVADDTRGEYRRKVRISSGNFQNLFYFGKNLLIFWRPVAFIFWSHKVLRWFTPFLLILCFVSSVVLSLFNPLFLILAGLQLAGFLAPAIDHLVRFNNPLVKFISHFYLMNFALFQGFINFSKGIKTSIWQPIKRNV